MSLQSFLFRVGAARSDKKRDAAIPIPDGVTQVKNLSYGPVPKSRPGRQLPPRGEAF